MCKDQRKNLHIDKMLPFTLAETLPRRSHASSLFSVLAVLVEVVVEKDEI